MEIDPQVNRIYQTSPSIFIIDSRVGARGLRGEPGGAFQAYIFVPGLLEANNTVLRVPMGFPVRFPAGLAACKATSITPATATSVFTLKRQNVSGTISFGQITFTAGSSSGVFSSSSNTDFTADDNLIITTPLNVDLTLADVGITIIGTRT